MSLDPDALNSPQAKSLVAGLRSTTVPNPGTQNDRTPPSKVTHMANVRVLYAVNKTLKEVQGNPSADPICLMVLESMQEFFDGVTGIVPPQKALERLRAVVGASAAPSVTPPGLPATAPQLVGQAGPPGQVEAPGGPPQGGPMMGNSPMAPPSA